MNWLSSLAAARLIEALPGLGLDPDDVELIERRVLPRWQRQRLRCERRDQAVRDLAATYLGVLPLPTGREVAKLIAADCRRPPPDDPRRPLVDAILANSLPDRPPRFGTVRGALIGVPRWGQAPKPFEREVVQPQRLARPVRGRNSPVSAGQNRP